MACMYDNFKGGGSCNGKHNEKETVLVGANTTASNPSYGIHSSKDNTQTFDGLKIRMTNMIAAGGNLASPFVQVLGLSEEKMPSSKVPKGLIIFKIRGLSPGGGLSPHSELYGYVVLVRKGVGIETEMFCEYGECV